MDIKTVGGMAIIGTLAAAWGQVKSFLNSIRNLFIVTHKVETYFSHRIVMEWLDENISFVNLGSKTFIMLRLWNSDKTHTPLAVWNRMIGSHLAFYNKRTPVIISFTAYNNIRITYIKGTFPVVHMCEELVKMCEDRIAAEDDAIGGVGFWIRHIWGKLSTPMMMAKEENAPIGRDSGESVAAPGADATSADDHNVAGLVSIMSIKHGVFTPLAGNVESVTQSEEVTPLQDRMVKRNRWIKRLYLTPAQREVINEVRFWMRSRDWYRSRGIPWRRSMLLFGPPGTGKSSLAYAISSALDIPLAIYHLDTMTDRDLVEEWGSGGSQAEIRLLEDFDTIFTGRKNNFLTDMNNALSFECLLNVLDGVVTAEGSLTIITTNHREMLDSALLRPGRIDTQVEFGPLDMEGKLHIGHTILPDMSEEALKVFFNETLPDDAVGAVVQEACIKHALKTYWAGER